MCNIFPAPQKEIGPLKYLSITLEEVRITASHMLVPAGPTCGERSLLAFHKPLQGSDLNHGLAVW